MYILSNVIKLNCKQNKFGVFVCWFFTSGVLVLNPQVSSGHITKPTQFGSMLAVFARMRPRI